VEGPISLDDFATKMKERAQFYRDEYAFGEQLRMEAETGNITRYPMPNQPGGDQTFQLLHWGLATLGIKLQIPSSYAQRCPPSLRAANFNYWLEVNKKKEFFIRLDSHPDGVEKIRAVLSKKYADFPNTELAKLIRDNADPSYGFMIQYEHTPERVVGELVAGDPKYNTNTHAGGIRLMNSEIGLNCLVFETLIYSKADRSGVIMQEWGGFSEKHIGDKKLIGERFKKVIDEIMANFGSAIQQLEDLKKISVVDVPDMVEVIAGSYKLKKSVVLALERALLTMQPKTLYDIVTVFTKASIDPALGLEDRETLQRVGGKIVLNAKKYQRWSIPIGERSVT
jgi:hypothetical protein